MDSSPAPASPEKPEGPRNRPQRGKTPSKSASIAADTILMLTQERQALRDGLRDLLGLWDRATGMAHDPSGYTAKDVLRLAEIRAMIAGGS